MKDKLNKQTSLLKEVVEKTVSDELFEFELSDYFSSKKEKGKVWLLGAGKASMAMARQAEDFFGDSIIDGMIIAPEKSKALNRIQVFEGSHPYPDQNSISASYELRDLIKKIPPGDTIIFCLSGGASSLFCIPFGEIELDEFTKTYELLLNSGASIHQVNTVRKHLSETAGGKLGALLQDRNLISLILSDVPGDDPEVIGSGPTVPDSSTFKDAFQVLKRFQLWEKVPHSVRIHISKGMHGDAEENPKPDEINWCNHRVEVISGARILADKVGQFLSQNGYKVQVADKAYNLDVKQISKKICSDAVAILSKKSALKEPAALVYFGESTVEVAGNGKGGRNQQLALNAAISIEGQNPISLLSLATDGIDGPTDAAGALINSQTTLAARKKKLNPEDYLQNNDAYHFHEAMDSLLKTGASGNNLMDLQVVLIG